MDSIEIEKQVSEYRNKRGRYQDFVNALELLVQQLLKSEDIRVVAIEGRTKDIESFRTKIEREDKPYTDPINQVTDLAGIRIVTYLLADVERVSAIIREAFEIDEANSINKSAALDADQFGYLSVHYVVKLNANRALLPENKTFKDLRAEIQIRTVLQHAWAAFDHKLRYKKAEEIPDELRRELYSISALLEVADKSFESLVFKIAKLRERYSVDVVQNSINLPLNIDSIGAYVNKNKNAKMLIDAALAANIVLAPHPPIAILPEFSNLLRILRTLKIETIEDLDRFVAEFLATKSDKLAKLVESWKRRIQTPKISLVITKDALFRWAIYLALPPSEAKLIQDRLTMSSLIRESLDEVYGTIVDPKKSPTP